MSKAEELLERWLKNSPSDVDLFIYRDTRNYLNRKDKLVEGGEWECVANCYCEFWGDCLKIEKGTVVQLQSNHGHTLAISRGIMPTQQFLLCFKPLKEGE